MLHDISVLVRHDTPEWPGDTPFSCGWIWERVKGASVNVSKFTMSPHVGTHADAPLHVRDGWAGVGALPLDAFRGPAWILGVEDAPALVEYEWIERRLPARVETRLERLLLRTGRTVADGRFPDAWPALSVECAGRLVTRGLRLLGVDAPSVDTRESQELPVHHLLFLGGAYNLENLDLRGVPDGEYELTAYPLRIDGLDAAPVRAVLERRAGA
jgi:arylformamidase